jgi:tRNA (cmo5U34)-methyltransferase
MSSQNLTAFSDKAQAESYDERFVKLAPVRDAMHALAIGVLSDLPADARVLCVGAGTGAEVLSLARAYPGWSFTAVEPAAAMLDVCRQRVAAEGFSDRCVFHEGYLDSLPPSDAFHAAASILVSQFVLDSEERRGFFSGIAKRLLPGGQLVSADLSADLSSARYESQLEVWLKMMVSPALPAEKVAQMRIAYGRDVAVIPPHEMEQLLVSSGFEAPVEFFQGLLIHAWFARTPASA